MITKEVEQWRRVVVVLEHRVANVVDAVQSNEVTAGLFRELDFNYGVDPLSQLLWSATEGDQCGNAGTTALMVMKIVAAIGGPSVPSGVDFARGGFCSFIVEDVDTTYNDWIPTQGPSESPSGLQEITLNGLERYTDAAFEQQCAGARGMVDAPPPSPFSPRAPTLAGSASPARRRSS